VRPAIDERSSVDGEVNAVRGKPAVRWLSIPQLVRTALEIRKVTKYARSQDRRLEFADDPRKFYRLPEQADEVRVDFVADTGDGFDTTFATALCVAGHPTLETTETRGNGKRTADLFVLGGDLVYPIASAARYQEQLTDVFQHAADLAEMGPDKPLVVALPGNHDWYDRLDAFLELMCGQNGAAAGEQNPIPLPIDDGDDVGGWRAFQSRSYFAVRLTPDWWLWGVDSQLDAPIDPVQTEYFTAARKHLGGAAIILCTATPSWLEAADGEPGGQPTGSPFDNLISFVDEVLGVPDRDRIRLILTGDKHHYAHYVPAENAGFRPHLVTCGGGGAFLSSTHHLPETLNPFWAPAGDPAHTLARSYPAADDSRELVATPKFLAVGVRNGLTLPALAGAVGVALLATLRCGLLPAVISAAVLALAFGFYAKYGKNERAPRMATGALLAIGHTAAHVGVAGAAAWFFTQVLPLGFWWSLAAAFLPLVVLNTAVYATYLHIADHFGWHTLEAFSGMRFEEYKSHLRMYVHEKGIRVSVVGMRAVPANRGKATPTFPRPQIIDTFEISRPS
jgi:hypothetical protein